MKKKSLPRVSVIIPAYNAEQFIEDSVKSITEQTFRDIEVIIIDDCSTDLTKKKIEILASKDTRIRVVSNSQNMGVGATRDRGIRESKGEYICWQDADDISLPNRIEQQVDFLDSHKDTGVVGGFITFFDDKTTGATRRYAEYDAALRGSIFKYNPVAQPASMTRKVCFDVVGGYDHSLRLSEDLEMLFRIGEKYKFGNVQSVVLKYRQTQGSLTAANLKKMEHATFAIRNAYKRSPAYKYSVSDRIYNMAQKSSMFIPTTMRMAIFKIVRGDT